MQNNKLIEFLTYKLNPARYNYAIGEQEMLSIIKTVNQYFKNSSKDTNIKIFKDRKHLLYSKHIR
jgi:RNase H-like domain found in reverse transcriptase